MTGEPLQDEGPNREEALQAYIKGKAEELEQSRWKVELGGKDIPVHDIVDKTIKGVLWAQDVIGQAVELSSEPHAGLIWAGVCLVLPVGKR